MIAYVEQRSGKSGLLRYAGQLYSKHVVLVNQGFPEPYPGFQGAHKPIVEANEKGLKPPSAQLEEAPNLSQIDRSYWLSGNPLPVTTENLNRGKEVFLQRCVGCHGLKGDGKGPAASFMSPPPADFTDKDDACCGGDTGPGDFYYRILRGWPGTAMENFGDRLSVDDIWRVVLFVKTIPNHTLKPNHLPTPDDYIVWQPSKELLAWVKTHQKLANNVSFDEKQSRDPYVQEAMRVFPGLAPGDSMRLNDGKTELSLAVRGRRHQGALRGHARSRVGRCARTRRETAARGDQGDPADRPGRAMRRRAFAFLIVAVAALVVPAAAFAHDQPETQQSRWVMADWMLDTFFVFAGAAVVAFIAMWKAGHFQELDKVAQVPLYIEEEDYYTPEWALDEEEWE